MTWPAPPATGADWGLGAGGSDDSGWMPLRIAGVDWKERVNCDTELGQMARARGMRVAVVGVAVRMDGRTEASRARGAARESIFIWVLSGYGEMSIAGRLLSRAALMMRRDRIIYIIDAHRLLLLVCLWAISVIG